MMAHPIRAVSANVRWTRTGAVWADWILEGLSYGLRPDKDKHRVRDLHTALIRALPGQSLLLGLSSSVDPTAIVEAMLAGIEPQPHPDWLAECQATLDTLDALGPGQRVYWLSVPLGTDQLSDRLAEPAKAVMANVRDWVGLPRAHIDPADVARRRQQAARVAENVPAPFCARPASPAQMVWLHEHQLHRGLAADQIMPEAADSHLAGDIPHKSGSAFSDPMLDEGGQTDMNGSKHHSLSMLSRRFLKVVDTSIDEADSSYQGLSVVADVPSDGMVFPGSEILGRIDEAGINVDWCMRLTVRSSAQVTARNAKALRNLNDQLGQRDADTNPGASVVERAGAALAEYSTTLDADKLEVEAQATIITCVAGGDPDIVRQQVQHLSGFFAEAGYKLTQPVGYQQALWWAMTPGVPSGSVVREFAQITTSSSLAALVPLSSTRLGDQRGSLLGVNIGNGPLLDENLPCGPTSVVLHDPDGASDRDVSGSVAIAGELGSGKSLTLKVLAGGVIDRGGHVIVADRTAVGEYGQWAQSVTQSTVVDIAAPQVSLDPVRMFGPRVGARITQSFLTTLLNVAPTSGRGVLLSEALDPDYIADQQIGSLGALVDHLAGECADPEAIEVARVIGVFAKKDLGSVIFDASLPALDLTDAAVIVRTHTLALPTAEELEHAHLFDQLPLEKIFGRAVYALIAAVARHTCFSDPNRLGVFLVDEAHSVTISPEAEREVTDFVRDGRKHKAAVLLGSHDPHADFGSATLRGLIPTRILMRHRDRTLAARGLEWLDLDPEDDDLLSLVRFDMSPASDADNQVPSWRRGESLMRDATGNVGRAKVMMPSLPARCDAVRTSGPAGGSPQQEF